MLSLSYLDVMLAYWKWLLASTLTDKTDFGTLESCLLTKAYQRCWNLMKINLIVVISIIYFYPYVKQGCVFLSF